MFGDGPDGGREASFDGPLNYSTSRSGRWCGYGVLQAKFRRVGAGKGDAAWLRRRVVAELDAWLDPSRKRAADSRPPEYLIIATNVRLSSAARNGGIDRIDALLAGHADRVGLTAWAVWPAGVVLSGVLADAFGLHAAVWATAASGLLAAARMYETRNPPGH
jgi:hypothetical protein